MPADFETYFRALAATAIDDKTEHMDRAALQTLLQAACDDAEPGARVLHEPRRDKGGAGSPDFKIVRAGRIAGYVEVKPIDENLSKVLKSDQIKKYKTLSDNIIVTDYLTHYRRVLTLDEIDHVGAVADALAFTIEQMAAIDIAYRKAFPDRG
ncbi:MAG: hypothetical protein M3T55_06355 [Pseudomonadota bacterium]|nr:hypothetical protein [Pseudomonadota bacterium]